MWHLRPRNPLPFLVGHPTEIGFQFYQQPPLDFSWFIVFGMFGQVVPQQAEWSRPHLVYDANATSIHPPF